MAALLFQAHQHISKQQMRQQQNAIRRSTRFDHKIHFIQLCVRAMRLRRRTYQSQHHVCMRR